MIHETSATALIIFAFFVAVVLGISFYLGSKAKSAKGYYAAHGGIPWFVNGIAFAGDYLSAASFLGICGMIAFFGYDGFLYSIGYLAGWVVALFVIAEPIKRLGKFTFADAMDARFNSRGIKLAVAISTLVVSVFYLIPQMVGSGALIRPLLGMKDWALGGFTLSAHAQGVIIVGLIVTLIVVMAGMVSTTWVQFIKGSLLVIFCAMLTIAILARGFTTQPHLQREDQRTFRVATRDKLIAPGGEELPEEGPWAGKPYVRVLYEGQIAPRIYRKITPNGILLGETQVVYDTIDKEGKSNRLIGGRQHGKNKEAGEDDLSPVGHVQTLPGGVTETGPLGPIEFFGVLNESIVVTWGSEKIQEAETLTTTIYYPKPTRGSDLLLPGGSPTFAGVRGDVFDESGGLNKAALFKKLDFLSLMLALFCGTASLPHILIRYYTVKDQASARKSTVVGIAAIGFFYILTLYLGLGAMTSGALDPTDNNMSAPLLARSFGELPFAIISAIAFTTVLGTVSGLIMAASGAVAHDLMENVFKVKMDDHQKVRAGKIAALFVGVIAIFLGIVFQKMNVSFLVGWAFNVAASANLPALVMLLFWRGTTKQGIVAAVVTGMVTSLGWILLSGQVYRDVYGADPAAAPMPWSQPGLVTIPLGFIVLIVVSLATRKRPAEA